MKRLLLLACCVATLIPRAEAWEPPSSFILVPPMDAALVTIDDSNFTINAGQFFSVSTIQLFEGHLFAIANGLNYTNKGLMIGTPGFDFRYFPTGDWTPQPGQIPSNVASNFINAAGGTIICNPATFGIALNLGNEQGGAKFVTDAANVVNQGTITTTSLGLGDQGFIGLSGDNVDLSGGTLSIQGGLSFSNSLGWPPATETADSAGDFLDTGWDPVSSLSYDGVFDRTVVSSPFTVFSSTFGFALTTSMFLTNAEVYMQEPTDESIDDDGNITRIWRIVFIQDNSPTNVTNNVYFGGGAGTGGGAFHVKWTGYFTDPLTGLFVTNYFILSDFPAIRRGDAFVSGTGTTAPNNFSFAMSTNDPFPFPTSIPVAPGITSDPNFILLADDDEENDFAFANLNLVGTLNGTNAGPDGVISNLVGRVEITARNNLNLQQARVIGANVLLLNATNNFQGSPTVLSPYYSDLKLGVTGGSLNLSNLIVPTLPVFSPAPEGSTAVAGLEMGGIQAWSGSWIFEFDDDILDITVTNDYRVLMVNSCLRPYSPTVQQDVVLRAGPTGSTEIHEALNVGGRFFTDAQRFTIGPNGSGAWASSPQLNISSIDFIWSSALPNLQYFTNWGTLTTSNLTVFASGVSNLFQNPNTATPYQTFVNHGTITNQGTFIRANYFENTGVIADSPYGSIDVAADNIFMTNGLFVATNGAVTLAADNIIITNHGIQAGNAITLSPICSLSDGFLFGNKFGHPEPSNSVTGSNIWTTGNGFNLLVKPATADLLGTTVTNIGFAPGIIYNFWAGEDRGPSPAGDANTVAVGRLVLDARDSGITYNFTGTGLANAIYVDSLEMLNMATNSSGDVPSVSIASNMKIYYAEALLNGSSIAAQLAGKNGSRFIWVSNYAGAFSSGASGGTVYNAPLLASGLPVPGGTFDVTVTGPIPCATRLPGGGGSGGGDDTGGDDPAGPGPSTFGKLPFPVTTSSSGTVTFSQAKGIYNGLFYESDGVTPASSGSFTATTTGTGGFTAKLKLGTALYSFSGQFDSSGHWTKTVSGKGLAPLVVELNLNLSGNDQITGHVSKGTTWSSDLLAYRAAFNKNHTTPLKGKYTMVMPGGTASGTGDGFATVVVDLAGNVQWNGTLSDGTKSAQKSTLSKDGIWPLYAPVYSGAGAVLSWMKFENRSGDDFNGKLLWVLPAGVRPAKLDGFTNETHAVGARVTGIGSPGFSSGINMLSGGPLDSAIVNQISIVNGKVVNNGGSPLTLTLTPSTGLFTGTVQGLTFQGVVLEKKGAGFGFFLGGGESGQVYFGPTP